MEKTELLRVAETISMRGGDHTRAKILKQEVRILRAKEETMWKQRSRVQWLQGGDKNTKIFHSKATQRQRRNCIESIKDQDGSTKTGQKDIAELFVSYFSQLFATSNPSEFEPVLNGVAQCITEDMNQALIAEFTAVEVYQAVNQMAPQKAPGPDGMAPLFYQKYWHIIGEDVTKAVISCLHSGLLLQTINHTYITLIPKVKNPGKVSEFRPISLCNVFYKIISKVLSNRLKKVLPHIISDSQSAFVPGRLITDNVLVAFETLHHMKTQSSQASSMALKLDMSKAYDKVEWTFLERMMQKMGFHSKWISLILECVSTVTYSVLVNGEPHGCIKPTRGLQQGNPLSLYLFLICAEGLHALITTALMAGDIREVSLCRRGPRITHD
jgi:hypothetical protein